MIKKMFQADKPECIVQPLKTVLDGDGTVVISFKSPVGGTQEPILVYMKAKKPFLLLDVTAFLRKGRRSR